MVDFLLRKKSAMIECIQKVNKEDIIKYRKKLNMNNEYYMNINILGEDTFFQNALDLLNYKLPNSLQCINFCSNLCFGGFSKNSLGIHNIKPIQVNFCKKQIIEYLTNYNEEIKTVALKKKMNNILVTGGCGFIASNFLNYMIPKYTNLQFINIDALYYCADINNITKENQNAKNYKFIKGNICSKELVNHILQEYKIDTVIHFAAQSHVDNSFSNPLQYTKDNIVGTHTLLECCRKWANNKIYSCKYR